MEGQGNIFIRCKIRKWAAKASSYWQVARTDSGSYMQPHNVWHNDTDTSLLKKKTDCTINGGSWRISWSDICLGVGRLHLPAARKDRLVLCLFFPKLFRRTRILIQPPLIVVFQPQLLPICPPCQIQPNRHCYQMRGIIQLMTLLTNFTQRSIFIIQSPPRHINWFVLVTKSCFSPPKDRRRPRSPAQTSSPCSHRSRSRSSRRRSASSTTTRTESSPPPTWKRPLRWVHTSE